MLRPKNFHESKLPLSVVEMSLEDHAAWNQLQVNYGNNGFQYLEFYSEQVKEICPYVIVDFDKEFKNQILDKTHSVNFTFNEMIRSQETKIDHAFIRQKSTIKGFFIPADLIQIIGPKNWAKESYFLKELTTRFDIASYIQILTNGQTVKQEKRDICYEIIVQFLQNYFLSLDSIFNKEPSAFQEIKGLRMFYEEESITQFSPIQESIFYMNYLCESGFFENEERTAFWDERLNIHKSLRDIKALWALLLVGRKQWSDILDYLKVKGKDDYDSVSCFLYKNLDRYAFLRDFKFELEDLHEKYNGKSGFFGKVFRNNRDHVIHRKGHFLRSRKALEPSPFYALDHRSRLVAKDYIMEQLGRFGKSAWKKNYEKEDHACGKLFDIMNQIFYPWFYVEYKSKTLLAKYNTLDSLDFNHAIKSLQLKKYIRSQEEAYLQFLIKKVNSIYDMEALVDCFEDYRFSYPNLQNSWFSQFEIAKRSLNVRLRFRKTKMMEFGILETNVMSGYGKDIWLDEILAIESEVAEYVVFVKEAFAQALPIRRRSVFHPVRRTIDGVEVDPEMFMDPDKYLRAEIMKPMTTVIDQKEIHQVNAFCLDYSGSMTHERMRNLYKMLYLLVLGLEDKVSFDAFHFFSNNFIPGVEFKSSFTTKNILFDILTAISEIKHGKVVYRGQGGTNISDGITKTYERMQNFNQQLIAEDPDMHIVNSMFVISDGEPSVGLINTNDLKQMVDTLRMESGISMNGLYIYPEDEQTNYMTEIFGEKHAIEADDFRETVTRLVNHMTQTYKEQRLDFKWNLKAQKLANHG